MPIFKDIQVALPGLALFCPALTRFVNISLTQADGETTGLCTSSFLMQSSYNQ